MVQIVWSRRALVDLSTIRTYIDQFSPLAAQRMTARLRTAAASLHEYPERGRLAGHGARELTIVPPYVIRYRIARAEVLILRIKHGARAAE